MKIASKITIIVGTIILTTNSAAAFNFGFVRAPDYLDPFFIALLIAAFIFWIAVIFTKPRGIPFNQLYKTQMDPVPTYYFRILQAIVIIFMVLLFLGMGLQRYDEAQGLAHLSLEPHMSDIV
ncbi:hypothetical protein [Parasulfitobacter algicola]|uniref:Uncharacterized protein n=1 Tax=Parasulfitobacter algicola TaxID=2614809 RepID=A0ABX2IMV1_9RHOB|nr:hypothetical protein [Sulfitobacter algicola]NSX54207.1 hypothetical protein [Sulfitobacter algicola]